MLLTGQEFVLLVASFVIFLVLAVFVHEVAHAALYWVGGIPLSDIRFDVCGLNPCVLSSQKLDGIAKIGSDYAGGFTAAFVLWVSYIILYVRFSHLIFRISGGVILFLVGYQVSIGIMEGAANSWYLEPRSDLRETIYVLVGCSIALSIHWRVCGAHKKHLRIQEDKRLPI